MYVRSLERKISRELHKCRLVLDCVLCSNYSDAYVVFRGRHLLSKFFYIYLFFYLSISERSLAGKHNEHHSAVAWISLTQFLTVQGVSGYLASHDSTPGHCFALAAFISQRLRVR